MATTMTVRPGDWNELFGLWFQVRPDPLFGAETVRVTVHCHGAHLWFHTEGTCSGVTVQTVAPDQVA